MLYRFQSDGGLLRPERCPLEMRARCLNFRLHASRGVKTRLATS
jgi:hypothetical protein